MIDPQTYRIPLEVAHQILATFGISKPTRAYERWVKPDGFDLRDFDSVLFESPFIFVIDWRDALDEVLDRVVQALSELNVDLVIDLDEDGESGFLGSGPTRRAPVAYRPSDDSGLESVFRSLQSVVPDTVEFRESTDNEGSDTSVFAVLPRDEWQDLERLAPDVMRSLFRPRKDLAH
jgi:hypothetical protein